MANESTFNNAVASGRTGLVTATTAYGVLAGGTTATGSFQNCGAGTANQVLTSNGAGVLPSWENPPAPVTAVCKVWASLNGTGTIELRDSFNINSVADNGTGDYTFTIETDFGDADYSVQSSTSDSPSASPCTSTMHDDSTVRTAGAFRIYCATTAASPVLYDTAFMDVACFGNQ